jgi:hypothetical protein
MHLSTQHRDALLQSIQHPVNRDIEWRAALSLLDATASVEEHRFGRFLVTIGAETVMFERPKHIDVRRMLRDAGYEPEAHDVRRRTRRPEA